MNSYDIVIAGYGPTGAVAANLLGAQGFKVLVVEPNEAIYDIPRAVHIDGEVMRVFQELGLSAEIDSVAGTPEILRFVNGRNWTLLYQDLTELPRTNGWANDIFFNQPRMEVHLRAGVARFQNVEERLGWELYHFEQDDQQVLVTIRQAKEAQSEHVTCRYLLACDGASSPTRQLLNINLTDLECDEPWLVCDQMLEEGSEHSRDVYQICDPARPTTLVPCEGSHVRWEFMLLPGDDVANLEDEATARSMMAPHMSRLAPGLSSDAGELVRSKVYTFHALIADTFQSGRVFLLGDAAHQTPPFLGQGLCAGVRDAYNLSWKIAGVLRGEFNTGLLDSYTTERRPHVQEVVSTAVTHGNIIQTTNPIKAMVRDCMLMLARVFPALAPDLDLGGSWVLGEGLLDRDGEPANEGNIGRPIPQPEVERSDGQRVKFDEILGQGFTLLGFDLDPAPLLKESGGHKLTLDCLHLGPDGQARDLTGTLSDWRQTTGASLALIRPDRQVYAICREADGNLAGQLARVLGKLEAVLLGS